MCDYVCVWPCIRTCYIRNYLRIWIRSYTHTPPLYLHIHTSVRAYHNKFGLHFEICIHACSMHTYEYACTNAYMYAIMRVWTYACVYVCACYTVAISAADTCTHVCMRACTCVYVCVCYKLEISAALSSRGTLVFACTRFVAGDTPPGAHKLYFLLQEPRTLWKHLQEHTHERLVLVVRGGWSDAGGRAQLWETLSPRCWACCRRYKAVMQAHANLFPEKTW